MALTLKARCIFFDVDHTLISKISTEVLFIRWLLLHGKISIRNFFASAGFFLFHLDDLQCSALRGNKMYLRGIPLQALQEYAKIVSKQQIRKRLSRKGLEEIKTLRRSGKKVILLSAAPRFLVEDIQLESGADDVIATELEFKDGIATGQIIQDRHFYGRQKVVAAKAYAKERNLPLVECAAYANAASDLPLLQSVGEPVAVNPDRVLRSWAKSHDWPIYYLT